VRYVIGELLGFAVGVEGLYVSYHATMKEMRSFLVCLIAESLKWIGKANLFATLQLD